MSWNAEEFETRLRTVGEERYHHLHPFNLRMHDGTLARAEIQIWVRNRYYYQTRIPIKDGLILAKAQDPDFRREWIQRIYDHDGHRAGEGGLELWLALGEAVGLDRDDVASLVEILPGVRRACDDYVEFVDSHDLLESVASSLTEMFAGDIMTTRIAAFEEHYPWVRTEGLEYFRTRTVQAPRDASQGLTFVIEHARTAEDQKRCVAALERKCQILWNLLDGVEASSARHGLSPHAIWREDPQEGTLVVLPERAVKINPTGREILNLCDGARSSLDIAEILKERHPDVSSIGSDIHDFLDEMHRLGVTQHAK